ncbi:crotonase/enoyl-CoA hydratase family protein [Pseudogulbenkiania ferrooxidans]|uniref:Enoyl-CoA hydratase/isomerase n=1 Tax=Pseudogulbenkiania ferrooxidans 2002 TaxID=279714 RepID=B9Z0U2_9NEIS|nr:crotonase/enoyl-CoA hydratase family protein [Pseudogulbenkiania ferrooxidans]EEG09698.1 Enoyl-CoA hydratase/isomerase [Pseudogulbenkiania ferrooxidans 2002]
MDFDTLTLSVDGHVAQVSFNRPNKANALNETMWQELGAAMTWCDTEPDVRAIVLAGEGAHFCSGIDLAMLLGVQQTIQDPCEGRKREKLRTLILRLQDAVTSLERCRKPVIVAIHGACLGGGLDIALAADIRLAAADAVFGVREVDIGMVADVGTLQRLPAIVGEGVAREMALTGREVKAEEAQAIRLVNRVLPDRASLQTEALSMARLIAAKSPLSIRGSKEVMNYSRDHSVADGLNYVATWNAAMLLSDDIQRAAIAAMHGQLAVFDN